MKEPRQLEMDLTGLRQTADLGTVSDEQQIRSILNGLDELEANLK
jgi:hypothetical protein